MRAAVTMRFAELKISREEGSSAAKRERRAAEGLQQIHSAPPLIRLLDKRPREPPTPPALLEGDRGRQVNIKKKGKKKFVVVATNRVGRRGIISKQSRRAPGGST